MLKNVVISCENGFIKLSWEWENKNIESVKIYYKKREIIEGDGSIFMQEEIMRLPYNKVGKAERPISGERGVYTFTFVPKMTDHSMGRKTVIENVVLGEIIRIPWKISLQKGNQALSFQKFLGKIDAGITCLKIGNFTHHLDYEVTQDTILMFPFESDIEKLKIYAKSPYDKIYHFYRSN